MTDNDLVVRAAVESDIDEIAGMIDELAKGHLAENWKRQKSSLKQAYFNGAPIAYLYIAERKSIILGMAQWVRQYDMFWSQFGGVLEWLYVKPEYRGSGVAAAIVVELCSQIRKSGGSYAMGEGLNPNVSKLYERVAIGWSARKCSIAGEAFQVFADLSGMPLRQIVKGLPKHELNYALPNKR